MTDERQDCCVWFRLDLAFHGQHFHAANGKRIDPRLVEVKPDDR